MRTRSRSPPMLMGGFMRSVWLLKPTTPSAGAGAAAGAHSIEHGYIMDDECIALLLEHDTWYVPSPSAILRPARPPIGSKPLGLRSAGSRMRYVAVPRQPRTCSKPPN